MSDARARSIAEAAGFTYVRWSPCNGNLARCAVIEARGKKGRVFQYHVRDERCLSSEVRPDAGPMQSIDELKPAPSPARSQLLARHRVPDGKFMRRHAVHEVPGARCRQAPDVRRLHGQPRPLLPRQLPAHRELVPVDRGRRIHRRNAGEDGVQGGSCPSYTVRVESSKGEGGSDCVKSTPMTCKKDSQGGCVCTPDGRIKATEVCA